MKCSTAGCYAVAFNRSLCRNHWYMWRDQLTTASGSTERGLRATPAPTSRLDGRKPGYIGPCRCDVPNPQRIAWFDTWQCSNCGMPLRERISDEGIPAEAMRVLR